MRGPFRSAALLGLALLVPTAAMAGTFKIDPEHTSVSFRVRHLLTWVDGRFGDFEGTITFDPAKPEATRVEGTIDVASIDTGNEDRDKHLRSADFFAVETFPRITFKSTKVSDYDTEAKHGKLHGNLTIRDVTKPVVLDAEYLGQATDPWGNTKAAFSGETTINRKDFGLAWNKTLETGGVLVGDEIRIRIDAETHVQKDGE